MQGQVGTASRMGRIALAVLAITAMAAVTGAAVTLKGYVNAVYDEDYNATGGTLAGTDGVEYKIVWDEKGRAMVDDVYEEQAEVSGEVAEMDGAKWLTVTSYARTAVEQPSPALEPSLTEMDEEQIVLEEEGVLVEEGGMMIEEEDVAPEMEEGVAPEQEDLSIEQSPAETSEGVIEPAAE